MSLIISTDAYARAAVIPSGESSLIVIPLPTEQKVITVGKENADFNDLHDALNSITDASFINKYKIQVGPGVFELRWPLEMKDHVDLVGSGRLETVISGTFFANGRAKSGAVVVAASRGLIENLTIKSIPASRSSSAFSSALLINEGGSPKISNVNVTMYNGPFCTAIDIQNSDPAIIDTEVVVTKCNRDQTGIKIFRADVNIDNVNVAVSDGNSKQFGVSANFSNANIINSIVEVSSSLKLQYGISNGGTNLIMSDSMVKVENGGRPDREFGIFTTDSLSSNNTISASRVEAPLTSIKAAEGTVDAQTIISDTTVAGDITGIAMCTNVITTDNVSLDVNCLPQ